MHISQSETKISYSCLVSQTLSTLCNFNGLCQSMFWIYQKRSVGVKGLSFRDAFAQHWVLNFLSVYSKTDTMRYSSNTNGPEMGRNSEFDELIYLSKYTYRQLIHNFHYSSWRTADNQGLGFYGCDFFISLSMFQTHKIKRSQQCFFFWYWV